jgi:hypothetical protein
MQRNPTKPPQSYDDIVRSTVVEPDSSRRPTRAQEQAARDGFRALDSDEQALDDRVASALASGGSSLAGVSVEISGELVTLRGRVPDVSALRFAEDTVARIPGVATIHNLVVVGAP